jgi:hypothetical protein
MARDEQKKRVGFFGWIRRIVMLLALGAIAAGGWWFYQGRQEVEVLKQIVSRLTSETKVARVEVVDVQEDQGGRMQKIRLKIVEFASGNRELEPIFCDFSVNDVVHFEALVIRLNDELIMEGEGKSIHLFRRAFALDDDGNTYESCDINRPQEVPGGYSLQSSDPKVQEIERRYWSKFWEYALDEKKRERAGVKTAQLEAPGMRFVRGIKYVIYLESDGGLRFDPKAIHKREPNKIETPDKKTEVGQ